MNRVELVGRIVREPEAKITANGKAMLRNTIAVNRDTKNKNGEYEADFINFIAFEHNAGFIQKYVKKGNLISLEGKIQTGSYEKDGNKVYTFDVLVDRVHLLEKKNKEDESKEPAKEKEEPIEIKSVDEILGINDDSFPF